MDDEALHGVPGNDDSRSRTLESGPNCLFMRDCCFIFQEAAWLSRRCILTSAIV